jgi:uncharacterized protein (UPF0264 family)
MRKSTDRAIAPQVVSDADAEPLSENRPARTPKLLVSVRSAAESLVALAGGASYIDVKEPSHGSLGQASRAVQVEVVDAIDGFLNGGRSSGRQVTATAALGELGTNGSPSSHSPVRGYSLFKLGLSGCRGNRDWVDGLDVWRKHVGAVGADLAAVAYADHEAADAPDPREILDYAIDRRVPFLLVDTWGKKAGSLTSFFSVEDLASLLEEAHRHDVSVALAGSLRLEDIETLVRLDVDVLAVRGAACKDGKRELDLDPDRIGDLVQRLQTAVTKEARPSS